MELRETLRCEGNKLNCFPKDQSLSDFLYGPWRTKNLFWVQMYENKSPKQSTFTGNIALLPSDIMDFALLPAQRFWQETASLLDVIRHQSNLWEHALLRKNFQLHNKNHYADRGGCNVWVSHINYYYVLINLSTFQIWLTPAGYYN